MEMRKVFGNTLAEIMEKDTRIVVLDADLGRANGTGGLKERFPERAFNVGVAEQNMASVAAGLASYGFIPFISSFTPFVSRRICDQAAISIAYADMNVKIVGTDPGIAAELNGGTHMSTEDVAVMRSIPHMLVFEPADNVELKAAIPQIISHEGPVYMRIFRKEISDISDAGYKFDLYKASILREGEDVTILSSGIMVREAIGAAEILEGKGIKAEVINVHTIKPLDEKTIIESAKKTDAVVTVENHSKIGGLRSAVCEALMENYPVVLRSIGFNDIFGEVGRFQELRQKFGFTAENIAEKAMEAIKLKKSRKRGC